jgi:hypothetical protein
MPESVQYDVDYDILACNLHQIACALGTDSILSNGRAE